MFTGLVESTGTVARIEPLGEQARLSIEIPFSQELALGDSVAINGCCLTVAAIEENLTHFDLLAQTLRVTSLGALSPGNKVNLERAMLAGSRFGGHFVQGHVDGTGTLTAIEPLGQDHILRVSIPQNLLPYCIDKGSLTVDGISLTIAELYPEGAVFWITPHTWLHTHLHEARPGQPVNLEVDVLAKYVEKLIASRLPSSPSGPH